MRKINKYISMSILILFLFHATFGSIEYLYYNNVLQMITKVLAFTTLSFVILHIILSTIIVIPQIKNMIQTKTYYFKENKLFWLKNISGILITLFLVCHITTYLGEIYWKPDLKLLVLIFDLLFAISLVFHILVNVKPLLIDFGIKHNKKMLIIISVIILIILCYLIFGFIYFFLR